jgi:hypothetical protein
LIAATRDKANLGFLMYLADSTGYLGYVGVMVTRALGDERKNMLSFFHEMSLFVAVAAIVFVTAAAAWFVPRLPTDELTEDSVDQPEGAEL